MQNLFVPRFDSWFGSLHPHVYGGAYVTIAVLRILPMMFTRLMISRTPRWADIDFETKEWCLFSTKTKIYYIVPLASQLVAQLNIRSPVWGSMFLECDQGYAHYPKLQLIKIWSLWGMAATLFTLTVLGIRLRQSWLSEGKAFIFLLIFEISNNAPNGLFAWFEKR